MATYTAHRHREELEAMLEGLANRLEAPRSFAVEVDDAGDVDLEVIGALEPTATELAAFRHRVPASRLAEAAGPLPLIEAYDRLAARIDQAIPARALGAF